MFDLIEHEPARLREATSIVAVWTDQKATREIMLFLHASGVGTSRAAWIFKT